ncbi:SLBB domain-containing protein [Deminuibacter soli]|uniref:Capsule biosynthesis protein n=1 Tax=Deminuibacter soli TaxID=2291815 RepID=A0A3E1NFB8_9BACT|nr:SLBB domain-containing protein [Deminuibacter soli]RFM26675.1 hypothetical protein DXN05_19085 [Deminuibacter soli]
MMQPKLFLVLLAVLLYCYTYAQEIVKNTDLSQIEVDQLTDEQIMQYHQKFVASGFTEEQGLGMMASRGMPQTELDKLKARLRQLATAGDRYTGTRTRDSSMQDNMLKKTSLSRKEVKEGPQVFGADLFSSHSLSFEPDMNMATPLNYILGVTDGLQVTIYGTQEANYKLQVSPEGGVYIPNVGMVQVAGQTVEAATQLIRQRMGSTAYPTLKSGSSSLSVSLSKIKSIHVTIVGAFKPGTYTVSSLSTAFNALYAAGGPAGNGSYREIELLRNNKVFHLIDLYRFLLKGDQSDNIHLEDNDVIRIPVYRTRVCVNGEVKRPGIYEMLPGEHLNDLIDFAAGFSDSAFRAYISVVQLNGVERAMHDVYETAYTAYMPQSGDVFTVGKILSRFSNRVSIEGAVYRPGAYELVQGLTLAGLIRKAYGLREDAYVIRGQLIRRQEDLTQMMIPFDVKAVLANGSVADMALQREDKVLISSVNDLRDSFVVTIQGEIRHPGDFPYVDSISLKDLIIQAGGFTDAALAQTIEIGRIIKRSNLRDSDIQISQVMEISSGDDLAVGSANLRLKPFDVVTIRRKPGYRKVGVATATGEVQFPGPYVIEKADERISSLMKRAGGFAPFAYAEGAYLKRLRPVTTTSEIKQEKAIKIEQSLKDTSGAVAASVTRAYDQIPLNLKHIVAHPGQDDDLMLQQGDELFVPKQDAQVHITGEVLSPTQLPYNPDYSMDDYIRAAGGYTDDARKKKTYILLANGKARTSHGFIFRSSPKPEPGSEIIVPKSKTRRGLSTGEIVGFSGIIISLASVVVALLR